MNDKTFIATNVLIYGMTSMQAPSTKLQKRFSASFGASGIVVFGLGQKPAKVLFIIRVTVPIDGRTIDLPADRIDILDPNAGRETILEKGNEPCDC